MIILEVDLHTHSTYSDGQYTPGELLEKVRKLGIKYYALTDHDTVDGVRELIKLEHSDVTIYSGVELSADCSEGQMHILGYNFDVDNERLRERLEYLRRCAKENMNGYLQQLKEKHNIEFSKSDLDELFSSANLHRPRLALLLIKRGFCESVSDAFDKYLKDEKAKKEIKGLAPEECIELIKQAGGVAILAHPWTIKLSNSDLKKKIKYLISKGLDGIEVYHSGSSEKNIRFYKDIAKELDLITTGGTDYHGEKIKPSIKLGLGKDNLNINENDVNLFKKVTSRY